MDFTMTPLHAGRLATLGKWLKIVPPEKFDLGTWGDHQEGNIDRKDRNILGIKQESNQEIVPKFDEMMNACGTTACALGWAAILPEFQEQGLKLVLGIGNYALGDDFDVPSKSDIDEAYEIDAASITLELSDEDAVKFKGQSHVNHYKMVSGKDKFALEDFEAGACFFGLSAVEAEQLFSPGRYAQGEYSQPIDVVEHIVHMLESHDYVDFAKDVTNAPTGKYIPWGNQHKKGQRWVMPK